MKMRQQVWDREGHEADFFVTLSTDSSPQGGLDYILTLEDRVSRASAGALMSATTPEEVERWAVDHVVETSTLPLGLVASGNANLSSKYEALFHSAKLDIGARPSLLQKYAMSCCVSFCSDYGTEAQFTEVTWLCKGEC